jgi:hypothetical protein
MGNIREFDVQTEVAGAPARDVAKDPNKETKLKSRRLEKHQE